MKRRFRLISMLCIIALLGGCGLSDSALRRYDPTSQLQMPETQEFGVLSSQPPLYTDCQPAALWGRSHLPERVRDAYDRMSEAIAAYRQEPLEIDADTNDVNLILTALRIDHPEYFWFDGEASFVTRTLAGVRYSTECTFTYTMSLEEIQTAHEAISAYTADCMASLGEARTDYDRILGVYRYIIEHTDYVLSEVDQSILSVMLRHEATCAGYARSFQYLMNQLDIPCVLALGSDENGNPHGWNMVQCGGDWYQMDVTWGDPVESDGTPGHSIQYTHCMITDQEMYLDHTLDCELAMPVCTATEYNYFVQSGRQMDDWDPAAYQAAMAEAVEQGEHWFSVRFSSQEAYDAAVYDLFRAEGIWDILQALGAVSDGENHLIYMQKDLQREISIQLGAGERES